MGEPTHVQKQRKNPFDTSLNYGWLMTVAIATDYLANGWKWWSPRKQGKYNWKFNNNFVGFEVYGLVRRETTSCITNTTTKLSSWYQTGCFNVLVPILYLMISSTQWWRIDVRIKSVVSADLRVHDNSRMGCTRDLKWSGLFSPRDFRFSISKYRKLQPEILVGSRFQALGR